MSNKAKQRLYTKTHEWLQPLDDGTVKIGITEHAQELLGDIVFVELPEADQKLAAGDNFAVIESVKSASDVYAPIAGTVLTVNEQLNDRPDLVNESAADLGWLIHLAPDTTNTEGLLTEEEYRTTISQ